MYVCFYESSVCVLMFEEGIHSSWKEAVFESVGSGSDGSQPAWWEDAEQGVSRVWVVLKDVWGPLVEAAWVDVAQVREWRADNPLSCFNHPLKVLFSAAVQLEYQTVHP